MTPYEAIQAMHKLLDEMHKRYVPDEERDAKARGALGFDYGYQQALYEVESRLYFAFPVTNTIAHMPEAVRLVADEDVIDFGLGQTEQQSRATHRIDNGIPGATLIEPSHHATPPAR